MRRGESPRSPTIAAGLRDGGKLLLFGNGGSAADATHIAAEFVGRFLLERRALPALSLADNASAVTAIGNDYGYDESSRARSGRSARRATSRSRSPRAAARRTCSRASQAARGRACATIGLTGAERAGRRRIRCRHLHPLATPRIQEAHTLVAHILCELVEARLARRPDRLEPARLAPSRAVFLDRDGTINGPARRASTCPQRPTFACSRARPRRSGPLNAHPARSPSSPTSGASHSAG